MVEFWYTYTPKAQISRYQPWTGSISTQCTVIQSEHQVHYNPIMFNNRYIYAEKSHSLAKRVGGSSPVPIRCPF